MPGPDMQGSVHGSSHDVIPNELIVQTFAPDAVPDLVVLERHRFKNLGGGRTRLTAQSLVESLEHGDAFLDASMPEAYERLDQLLAELSRRRPPDLGPMAAQRPNSRLPPRFCPPRESPGAWVPRSGAE